MKKFVLKIALLAAFVCTLVGASLPAHATPASGYWWNPAEPGRGFVIEIQGNAMFMAGFLYAASGEASWVASNGPMTSPTQYSGSLITYSGGQTLTGPYQSATQATAPLGTLAINFSSDTTGTVTWPGGTTPIQRFDFGPGGAAAAQLAGNPESGWWWNTGEGGRGFAVEVQGGTMYFAGYMYDSAGNPLWYLASGNVASASLFNGQWSQFANGETLSGPFKPAIVLNGNVGNVTLQFTNTYSATLSLPDGRQIPLTRFAFGVVPPVLSAFAPAASAPASLLTINGTGFDPSGTVTLRLFDSNGYSVSVPAASVSSTAIKVSVPPYIVAASSAFGSGAVQLQATQKSNGVSVTTNTLSGFGIQAVPAAAGTPGQSTLSLLRANLAEAQRLQSAVAGTAQGTPATIAALAQQVANLQSLVVNVQGVVQQGLSFTLGVVGGANITVTSANIADVDSLVLATLQSLANPPAGGAAYALKTAQAGGSGCLSAEATAFAAAMTSGNGNLDQLAQNLVQASGTSTPCGSVTAFTAAYQILGGAGDVGLGIVNGAGGGNVTNRLPGAALFAAASQNASVAVGLNALLSPALAPQTSSVQSAIAHVAALADPVTNQLLAKTTGTLAGNLSAAQVVTDSIAPPPTTTATASISGTISVGGAGIANAAVTVTDANGRAVNATSAADGSYTANVTGMTAPALVLATDPSGYNGPLLAPAASLPSSGSATVNITTLTTALAALLTGNGNPYTITPSSYTALITQSALNKAVSVLNQALSAILAANSQSAASFNPVTSKLVANNSGTDAVISAVNLMPYGAGFQLIAAASATQTLVLNSAAVAPSTPFSAPPVASNYLDFMQAALQKCLSVALASRNNDPQCTGLVDGFFQQSSYKALNTANPDFALATSVGATVAPPKTILFATNTNGDQIAYVRFRYTLTDGALGRMVAVMRQVPGGVTPVTLPSGAVVTWNFYGNQGSYDANVVSRAVRRTFLDTADVSFYQAGVRFYFNPGIAAAALVNTVNVTGPGLPGGGIWLFRSTACGTSSYMTISGAVRSGPPNGGSNSTTTSNTTLFSWGWAAQSPATVFTPPVTQTWASSPVDATTIPFAAIYTFQLYDNRGQTLATFTRRNLSPPVDAAYAAGAFWPTLSPASVAAFVAPGGALASPQASVPVSWINAPLGLPAYEAFASGGALGGGTTPATVDGYGFVDGATTSTTVRAGVSTDNQVTSLCAGSQFPSLVANSYRLLELFSRDPADVQVFDHVQYNN